MPTYVYECDDCELEDFEVRDFEKRDELMVCPECTQPMHRVFAATGYIRIKDQKLWKNTVTGQMEVKKRVRVMGTDIGRVRLDKLANELNDLHTHYDGDLKGQEAKDAAVEDRKKKAYRKATINTKNH